MSKDFPPFYYVYNICLSKQQLCETTFLTYSGGIIREILSEIPLAKSLLPLTMDSKILSSAKVEEIILNLISMKLGSSYHLKQQL